jgi:hypothetical protein
LTENKYRILLIYLIEGNGLYGGGYTDKALKITGGSTGESVDEMVEKAYESLKDGLTGENNIPFDINNIKESVVFDLIECHTEDEMEKAFDLERKGMDGKEINEVIQK